MVEPSELVRENIQTLQEYIRILEKLRRVLFGFRLNPAGRTILETVDQKIGWPTQWLAGICGLAMFLIGLGLGRIIARTPAIWLLVLAAAAFLGIGAVVLIFHLARRRIADLEIRKTQLEIYRLESLLNE